MRNFVASIIVAVMATVALSSAVVAQTEGQRPAPPDGFIKAGVPKMPNPPGPAPKRELTGAWVGPQNAVRDPVPPMTPAGEARFKLNKPKTLTQPWSGNDPFNVCDPLGLPRNAAGFPDSRFYGYSVGHWEGDNVFVIDTTGLDDRTWLDEAAHPHSTGARVQERYTRVDQYNIQLTVTVDDAKFYTKPWQLMKANYYWMKDQDFEETFCVPSEAIEYKNKVATPSGNEAGVK